MRAHIGHWLLSLGLMVTASSAAHAQAVAWSDDFNNGCASNCIASTWNGWTILDNDGGVTGGAPNNWFVSCGEEGIEPPGCGSSCIGDASLHIGGDPGSGGDMGADFNETGAANATFRMAVSPTINLSGRTASRLEFDYIAFGSSACSDDRAQLRLSTDNGATWPVGYQYCLNSVCCGGACNGYSQGQWTRYSLPLPAAFDNNPNVRVGFHWRNNGNGAGTNPSVAIDDIRISSPDIDLGITKSNGVDAVLPGNTVTYTIQVSRSWAPASVDANGVTVTDIFPPALTACSTTCVGSGGATCTAGPFTGDINDTANLPNTFSAGSSVTYTSVCTVSPTATGTLENSATIAGGAGYYDQSSANNSATDIDVVLTDGLFLDGFEN